MYSVSSFSFWAKKQVIKRNRISLLIISYFHIKRIIRNLTFGGVIIYILVMWFGFSSVGIRDFLLLRLRFSGLVLVPSSLSNTFVVFFLFPLVFVAFVKRFCIVEHYLVVIVSGVLGLVLSLERSERYSVLTNCIKYT